MNILCDTEHRISTGFIKWKKTLIEGQKIFDGTKIIYHSTLGIRGVIVCFVIDKAPCWGTRI